MWVSEHRRSWMREAQELCAWPVIDRAAEEVTLGIGRPISQVMGAVEIVNVLGPWTYVPAPGLVLCSADYLRESENLARALYALFESNFTGGA